VSLNAFPQFADCVLCSDTGIQHLPDYPPAYRFCLCAAGARRRDSEPAVVDEANARELRMGGGCD
jgi:hypothetical protein